ncbi:hypothetical protein P167DRAFT_534104 [Morchella conica CCBAS932]|uniref:Uncharacterized protein n=1 Tax=Morchella conica CCBAS932 TaxID=1392247 RepID=A0A3N4KUR6_9PEZI|nr:hypothetical protein P167DRAFT_534104 [Morchella conica CCBAS932]
MDQGTSPSAKIKEPREKLNATPEDVYSLLGYSWGERRQIITVVQKVYQRHNIAQHDMGYRKIDKDLIDKAKADLLAELPNLFKKCDSDWFADWALSRRHKTRNTKKTTTPSGSSSSSASKKDAQALDEDQMMMQAVDMGEQSTGNNSPENKVPPPPPPPPLALSMPPSTGINTPSTTTTTTTTVTPTTTATTTGSFRPW